MFEEEETNPDPSDDSSRKLLDSPDDISSHKTYRRTRKRRSVETNGGKVSRKSPEASQADVDSGFLSELNCGLTQCTFISCVIGPLRKREFTLFTVKSRLWVRTLNEIQRNDIEISSKLVSRVTKLPYGVNPSYLGYQTHVVTTQVRLDCTLHTQLTAMNVSLTSSGPGARPAFIWKYSSVDPDPRHPGGIFISLPPHFYPLQARVLSKEKARRL